MSKKIQAMVGIVLYSLPMLASAQVPGVKVNNFMTLLKNTFASVIPIVTALALIYFIYGLAEYILESGDEGKKADGRNRMIYGTIAMFVLASVWGIVIFLQEAIGVDKQGSSNIQLPYVP